MDPFRQSFRPRKKANMTAKTTLKPAILTRPKKFPPPAKIVLPNENFIQPANLESSLENSAPAVKPKYEIKKRTLPSTPYVPVRKSSSMVAKMIAKKIASGKPTMDAKKTMVGDSPRRGKRGIASPRNQTNTSPTTAKKRVRGSRNY